MTRVPRRGQVYWYSVHLYPPWGEAFTLKNGSRGDCQVFFSTLCSVNVDFPAVWSRCFGFRKLRKKQIWPWLLNSRTFKFERNNHRLLAAFAHCCLLIKCSSCSWQIYSWWRGIRIRGQKIQFSTASGQIKKNWPESTKLSYTVDGTITSVFWGGSFSGQMLGFQTYPAIYTYIFWLVRCSGRK